MTFVHWWICWRINALLCILKSIAAACKILISWCKDILLLFFSSLRTSLFACYVIYFFLWMQFSPVGHYFASSSHDRTARIWSMDRIQPLRIMAGHLSDVDVSYYIQYSLLLLIFATFCSFLGSVFATSSFNFIITYWRIDCFRFICQWFMIKQGFMMCVLKGENVSFICLL